MSVTNVFTSFADLPRRYEPIFEEAGRRSLYLSLDWFSHFDRTARDSGDEVRLYVVEDETGSPEAAIALRANRQGGAKHLTGLANFYSMHYSPLVAARGNPVPALTRLFAAIRSEQRGWAGIRLPSLGPRDESFAAVERSLRSAGFVTFPRLCWANWYVRTDSGFESYLSQRPSRLRKHFERSSKKLSASSTDRLQIITGLDGLESGIEAFTRVYAASWRDPELYPEFVPGFIRMLATKGLLRLGVIYIGDTPAAAQVWTVEQDRATIYKVAYDEQFRQKSVGNLLTLEMMRHVIEIDHVTEVDFGSGDDPYKADWMTTRREIFAIDAYNPLTMQGLAGIAREVGGEVIRRALRPAAREPKMAEQVATAASSR